MNILDENVIENQCRLLQSWRIHFQQIGLTFGKQGMDDKDIIPQLLKLDRPTFFTRDDGFFDYKLCHPRYCLVYLGIRKDEVATFVRRVLKHQNFSTKIKRMGCVIRASHTGLTVWRLHTENQIHYNWTD